MRSTSSVAVIVVLGRLLQTTAVVAQPTLSYPSSELKEGRGYVQSLTGVVNIAVLRATSVTA
jgi:hypothetical protein